MTDPIADMLIRIKNAQAAKKVVVSFGYSKIKFEIAKILENKGYLGTIERYGRKNGRFFEAELLYDKSGGPKISGARRVSKSSRRVYKGWREIYAPFGGMGLAIYSTPKGLKTDREARKEKVGGELLLEIW
ncbi:30S ribosomal protein S8 [Candidatus Giovannonibacteria bacterium RIFCSPLOWO2_01_FULL_44_40]|uniref:Small ribosomal subunit protein uS8 n=1 Tax=Candidatus Giovannonibacteria bacterium RIFCSPHIGHO2_01_FULL_45_23 TaxID=1798325 RepID=A0A1F5VIQ7_9BACT|nr:MAG: 30S ribosomal protein S8 [Candidatus Giovannonibacteria bacterium RIFCSPHIGHO2_01_FULL_45_23]OGF76857.1 MAG: 30S ribosomal protein S8 [Candidatus Giovannonibacteria bacterium RIFCSPHIGHO2_02_FULL_45_13]OGF80341.1 MAG: 30S ribosomal protein S8 [Candidatus Giovannonibacteria bacterium RIFCSPLOWO2_01_FULL_44_40]